MKDFAPEWDRNY